MRVPDFAAGLFALRPGLLRFDDDLRGAPEAFFVFAGDLPLAIDLADFFAVFADLVFATIMFN